MARQTLRSAESRRRPKAPIGRIDCHIRLISCTRPKEKKDKSRKNKKLISFSIHSIRSTHPIHPITGHRVDGADCSSDSITLHFGLQLTTKCLNQAPASSRMFQRTHQSRLIELPVDGPPSRPKQII